MNSLCLLGISLPVTGTPVGLTKLAVVVPVPRESDSRTGPVARVTVAMSTAVAATAG